MTDSDAKEWVTIKVPKAVRDDARDDPRTYGEVMRDGLDDDGGLGDELYGLIDDDGDAVEAVRELRGRGGIPDDLREQLDRIEAAATTTEDRTGQIQTALEDAGLGR